MERMDMDSRNQYLKVLRERYLKARTKKEKAQILDEYCCNTGQARKYVIRKIQPGVELTPKRGRKGKRLMMAKSRQLYPGYGRSLTTPVVKGLSPYWR